MLLSPTTKTLVVGLLVTFGGGLFLWLAKAVLLRCYRWYQRRFGRKLTFASDHTYSVVGRTAVAWTTQADGWGWVDQSGLFLRLRIFNPALRPAPANVVVTVESVGRRADTGRYERIREDKFPMTLVWSRTEQQGQGAIVSWETLVERQKLVDIACVFEPRAGDVIALQLVTEPKPRDNSHCFPPGAYRFGLAVASSNHASSALTVDIELLGRWSKEISEVARCTVRSGEPKYEELFEQSLR